MSTCDVITVHFSPIECDTLVHLLVASKGGTIRKFYVMTIVATIIVIHDIITIISNNIFFKFFKKCEKILNTCRHIKKKLINFKKREWK